MLTYEKKTITNLYLYIDKILNLIKNILISCKNILEKYILKLYFKLNIYILSCSIFLFHNNKKMSMFLLKKEAFSLYYIINEK